MAQDESVEAVDPVFRKVPGKLEGSSSVHNELLPFLFGLAPKDAHHLKLCVSDFHSQTWQSELSVSQLQDLRYDVGIGGEWNDFLSYLRAAFSSNFVELIFEGLGDSVDSPKSAKLVGQKDRGLPRVQLRLEKLEGSAAADAMASIALGNFSAFLALSSTLHSEKAQVVSLKALLAVEKAKAEKLEEQINASNGSLVGRKRQERTLSSLPASHLPIIPPAQLDTQPERPSLLTTVSGTLNEEVAAPVRTASKSRGRIPPAPRRVKRRGTIIGEADA